MRDDPVNEAAAASLLNASVVLNPTHLVKHLLYLLGEEGLGRNILVIGGFDPIIARHITKQDDGCCIRKQGECCLQPEENVSTTMQQLSSDGCVF